MKNIKNIFYLLLLCATRTYPMEETINYLESLTQSKLYKQFCAERNKLLIQLEEIRFKEDVQQPPGHLNFFNILKEISAQDKKYQNVFVNKEFKHFIIERNIHALNLENNQIK